MPVGKRFSEVSEGHCRVVGYCVVDYYSEQVLRLPVFRDQTRDLNALSLEDVGPLEIAGTVDVEKEFL
jgi:hypothetical protein